MQTQLHVQMCITQGRFSQEVRRAASGLGLLPGQPKVLEYLYEHDGCTQADIGEAWLLDKSTVSGLIDRLERDGLIQSRKDGQDKRRKAISLTPKGRALWQPMQERLSALDEAAWRGVSGAERAAFLMTLSRIRRNLEEGGGAS